MRRQNTKEKLIDAAIELFSAQGFDATSVGEIEARAGLSPRAGGFYRHFESKADILAELLGARLVETPDNLGLAGLLPLGDTRAELLVLARSYLRINQQNRALASVVSQELSRNPGLRRRLLAANTALLASLAEWLKAKPAAAGAGPAELKSLVGIVFGGWLFMLTKHLEETLPAEFDIEAYIDAWASFWARRLDGERL